MCAYSVTQSFPSFCDHMDCNLPGSSVHGVFQAKILEWVAISYSRGPSRPRDGTRVSWVFYIGRWMRYHHASLLSLLFSHSVVSDSLWLMDCSTPGSPVLHCLPELAQTHVHWVSDAMQLSHPLSPSPPPALFPSIRKWVPMSWVLASGGQSIGASASASVFPMNIPGWFPLGLAGLISLQSKGLSRIFSSTTIWKHQFFSAQPSLWSNSHVCTWLWKNHSFD